MLFVIHRGVTAGLRVNSATESSARQMFWMVSEGTVGTADYERISGVAREIQPLDTVAAAAARERQALLTKPAGSLGCLEEFAYQLAGITLRLEGGNDLETRVVAFVRHRARWPGALNGWRTGTRGSGMEAGGAWATVAHRRWQTVP